MPADIITPADGNNPAAAAAPLPPPSLVAPALRRELDEVAARLAQCEREVGAKEEQAARRALEVGALLCPSGRTGQEEGRAEAVGRPKGVKGWG